MPARLSRPSVLNRRRASRAFTLLELMLVLVILGVLASVAAIAVTGQADNARRSATITSMQTVDRALRAYYLQKGAFPSTQESLAVLVPTYLEKEPLDGWKRRFAYFHPGTGGREYDLISNGKDGEYGTDDDIRNWELE